MQQPSKVTTHQKTNSEQSELRVSQTDQTQNGTNTNEGNDEGDDDGDIENVYIKRDIPPRSMLVMATKDEK